jgi:hypothetical protein
MPPPGLEHLPGTPLPARPFSITEQEDARFCSIVGDRSADDGTAHPLWGFVLSRRAIAVDLHELLALARFDVEDGPLLGSFDLELDGPLHVGRPYLTEIVIEAIERKRGRRAGVFDLMDIAHRYTTEDGTPAGRYTQQYVLPRRDA